MVILRTEIPDISAITDEGGLRRDPPELITGLVDGVKKKIKKSRIREKCTTFGTLN